MTKNNHEDLFKQVDEKYKVKLRMLAEINEDIAEISNRLIDAKEDQRKGLSNQLIDALQERDITSQEIFALNERRKIAYLTIYEMQLALAQNEKSEVLKLYEGVRVDTFQAFAEKKRSIVNNPDLGSQEKNIELIKLENEIANNKATQYVYQQELNKARNTVTRCEQELEKARAEIDKWK